EMTLIYKVVGRGTARLAMMVAGESIDMLVGLGNGFDARPAAGKRIALIGGGAGIPPLYGLMRKLYGEDVQAVLGFASAADVFYAAEFKALGARVYVTTSDGSSGRKGLVTDELAGMAYDYYFACGPEPMLRAVHGLGSEGQLSFEARMACGFGACMGCTCRTIAGHKRICADGPVLTSSEVAF
ncbi:MAG: dihydroorotate dehydrogenase electron transfer subunit, partial [Clostridia bacterium]|nr:dihydroorotate dehydrogenase electron transfer subunit [Clostridia bacterium]